MTTTGGNIGNCMTGFGIHYPITVFNYGNSEVFYTIKNSNQDNFDVSKNSFAINAGDSDIFNVLYKPTLTSSLTDEITNLTISSVSAEDASSDPNGNITVFITGSKLIDITGGNPRAFRVIGDSVNTEYTFYWKSPTGISGINLANYFITGYRLDLSENSNFNPNVYTKDFNIPINTDLNPKYSTYYGFSNDDYVFKLNKNLYNDLTVGTNYYARLYTMINNNTGVSVYATGVDSNTADLSNEVQIGYSGTPINIKIVKKAFDFHITFSTWYSYTYDLYNEIIKKNGSNDFSAYSGINIYLPEKSLFESRDGNMGAIKLDGLFNNLSGTNDTYINIYVPYNTELKGKYGDGTNLYYQKGMEFTSNTSPYGNGLKLTVEPQQLLNISQTNNGTSPTDPLKKYSDTTNGGPCITLKARTYLGSSLGERTDIKYNIYSQLPDINKVIDLGYGIKCEPKFGAGAGGSKGGFAYIDVFATRFAFYDTINTSDNLFYQVIPLNGTYPKGYLDDTTVNRKYWYYEVWYGGTSRLYVDKSGEFLNISNLAYYLTTDQVSAGEYGSSNLVYIDTSSKWYYFPYSSIDGSIPSSNQAYSYKLLPNILKWYPFNKDLTNRQPGFLIDSYSNAKINYSLYNKNLPTDYVFRFNQSGISASDSPKAKTWTGSGSYSLQNTSGSSEGVYTANYKNLGSSSYKTINLKNNQYLKLDFTSSVTFKDFDLFFVCSFDDFIATSSDVYSSLFDWYLTVSPDNITNDQFNIKNFNSLSALKYTKESVSFNYKNNFLSNNKDLSKDTNFGKKISKQLYIKLKVSNIDTSTNIITTSTKHNLTNGDEICFYADTLPSPIISYDPSSPYKEEKTTYKVSDVTDYTFKLGSLDITTTGTNVYVQKIVSNSLYRPFILQIRRTRNNYIYYINRTFVNTTYIQNNLITDLKGTTLKLINRNTTIGINYFDITFYNRLLSESELNSAYAYYVDTYMSLFTGEADCASIDLKSNLYDFKLPNIFNLAGKS